MLNHEDDIEKIYRDFAKNYPLKTEDSGWDEFLQKMDGVVGKGLPTNKPIGANKFFSNINKFGYWLTTAAAAVIIVTGVLFFTNKNDNNGPPAAQPATVNNTGTAPAVKQPAAPSAIAKAQSDTSKTFDTVQTAHIKPAVLTPQQSLVNSKGSTAIPISKNAPPVIEKADKKASLNKGNDLATQHNIEATETVKKGDEGVKKEVGKKQDNGGLGLPSDSQANSNISAKNGNSISQQNGLDKGIEAPIRSNSGSYVNKQPLLPSGSKDSTSITTNSNPAIDSTNGNTQVDIAETNGIKHLTTRPGTKTQSSNMPPTKADAMAPKEKDNNQADNVTKTQPLVKIHTGSSKYLYLGVVAGPDFSTVKFQQVKNTGFTAGLTFGLHLDNNVSIESGVLYSQKKYYSSAVYFKDPDLRPDERQLLQSVNASSQFIEVPLTIKYNILNKKRYNLFVNAGLSSYFTNDEKYELLLHMPFGDLVKRDKDNDACANIFSVINLSAGYEFKLNANNNLRIEPYIKIPMAGLGPGGLPVTSGGLYLHFTHSFFK